MKFQSVKGMHDTLPGDIEAWQIFELKSRSFLEAYGFREIRTPILESTELFSRSIGEASDIVHKEMYTFQDRGGRSLTLRPEMTASVVRSVLEHNLLKENEPLYLYYMGPMYRAERPQAGRTRQFHQLGVETLNTHSAVNDAELLIMTHSFLQSFGLKDFSVRLNNLGSVTDRKKFTERLAVYFKSHEKDLCPDCQYRLQKNVLRVLDCKVESCQKLIQGAPSIELSREAGGQFDQIQKFLRDAKVPFQIEPRLVRGLDYYTGCVFEVTCKGLGAQDALLAGGRYDGLIQSLGGPVTGASGFAMGIERFFMALEANQISLAKEALAKTVYIAGLIKTEAVCEFYRKIANHLAGAGVRAKYSFAEKSLGSHLKQANKLGVGFVVIVGEDEWKAGEVSLKNMETGEQKKYSIEQLRNAF